MSSAAKRTRGRAQCRACGAPVEWVKTCSGRRWLPLDAGATESWEPGLVVIWANTTVAATPEDCGRGIARRAHRCAGFPDPAYSMTPGSTRREWTTRKRATSVACPKCGVDSGRCCRTLKARTITNTHRERVNAVRGPGA